MHAFDLNMTGKMFNYGINKKKNVLFFMKSIFPSIFELGTSRLEDRSYIWYARNATGIDTQLINCFPVGFIATVCQTVVKVRVRTLMHRVLSIVSETLILIKILLSTYL